MARKIEHKDLFYKKPAPTYRSGRRRPHKRRRSPIVPFLLVIAAIVAVVFIINQNSKNKESNESSQQSALLSSDLQFDYVEEGSASSDIEDSGSSESSEDSSSSESSVIAEIDTDYDNMEPAVERDISDAEYDLFNTMMIVDSIGYRYFTFSETNSITYINLMKSAYDSFGSDVGFAVMILPDATDIMLPQSFLADVEGTSDQQKALDYLNASINAVAPDIQTINPYDILKANCNEDIYFKTDRHWTALGAYYGYRMYANSVGLTPLALTEFEQSSYDGFRGSLYTQSNNNEALNYTEPVVTYTPPFSISASYYQSGSMMETDLIADPSDYAADQKYNAFLGGDNAYTEIVNNDLSDGSSLIVVKDSMGNAMVPYLACHYQTLYVVDYRTYSMTVQDLVSSTGVKNVLFMCRLSATSESYDIALMDNVL